MKRISFVFLVVFICSASTLLAQKQEWGWIWAKKAGGRGADYGRLIAVDSENNSYVCGWTSQDTIEFGDGVTLIGEDSHFFVVKYNDQGTALWVRRVVQDAEIYAITVDAEKNIYLAGTFSDTCHFSSDLALIASGSSDIFLAKYDTSGNVLWAKRAGGQAASDLRSVSTDAAGNCYIFGTFKSTHMNFGGNVVLEAAEPGFFIAKYNSTGIIQWARSAVSMNEGNSSAGDGIADTEGNTFICGKFSGVAQFGSALNLVSTDASDGFIAKYDKNGALLWANIVASYGVSDQYPSAIAWNDNALLLCGEEYYTPYDVQNQTPRLKHFFIARYDTSGTKIWTKNIYKSSTLEDSFAAYDIAAGPAGESYVVGILGVFGSSPVTVDFGNTVSITDNGRQNAFILYNAPNGSALSAAIIHSTTGNVSQSVVADHNGNALLCGYYRGTTTFRDGLEFTGNDGGELYIAKYGRQTTSEVGHTPFKNESVQFYPQPARDILKISEPQRRGASVSLITILGQKVPLKEVAPQTYDLVPIPAGFYLLNIESVLHSKTYPIIIQK